MDIDDDNKNIITTTIIEKDNNEFSTYNEGIEIINNSTIKINNEEAPIKIKFNHKGIHVLKVRETDKMKYVIDKYCSEVGINSAQISFCYNYMDFTYNKIVDKKISEIITNADKKSKEMNIYVTELERESIVNIDIENDFEEKFIDKKDNRIIYFIIKFPNKKQY